MSVEVLTVEAEVSGERLDRWLARTLDQPRNKIQRWIDDGLVRLDGKPVKASASLSTGQEIQVSPPSDPGDPSVVPEQQALSLLYLDDHLLIVDKAAGVSVHPGAGRRTGTLANFLIHDFPEMIGVGGPGRPGIVHRLDIGTTGALVVARSEACYRGLSRAFSDRKVEKRYLALVWGAPKPSGTIDLAIGRHAEDRKKMTVRSDGRPATSKYQLIANNGPISLVEIDLATGRTHQIRVHMKAIGHPLVGDSTYGEERWKGLRRALQGPLKSFPRPALHAWRLRFDHPITHQPIEVEAPPPADLRELWRELGGDWPTGKDGFPLSRE